MPTPTNPLVRIAESDTNTPSTGLPNKKVPNTALLNIGWDKDQIFAANHLNYIFDNLAEYIVWLQEQKDALQLKVDSLELPVGSIYENATNSANPFTLLGYGTWIPFAEGKVTVGVGSHTDDAGLSRTWVVGDEEGEYKHTQTVDELAVHNHTAESVADHTHPMNMDTDEANDALGGNRRIMTNDTQPSTSVTDATHITTGAAGGHTPVIKNTGNSTAMNNVQPSIAVYKWIRTA